MLKSAAVSIIGGLLLRLLLPQQFPPPVPVKPAFISEEIPAGHFLGISPEGSQPSEAKDKAINNVIKQILQHIGAEYHLDFIKISSSDRNYLNVSSRDSFSISSGGILGDVEIKNLHLEKTEGRYIGYVLAFFPHESTVAAREAIERENNRRVAIYNDYLYKGMHLEAGKNIIAALNCYRMAADQAAFLFRNRGQRISAARRQIKNLIGSLSIRPHSNYDQRSSRAVSCQVLFRGTPVQGVPIAFWLLEGSGALDPQTITNTDGIATCGVILKQEVPHNRISARIDVEGIDAFTTFAFSTINPQPVLHVSPLEIVDNGFAFTISESNHVDTIFDRYEIDIQADYRLSSFISYYIVHVDRHNGITGSFNLQTPIKIHGGSTQNVVIPFNSWARKNKDDLDRWYLGSSLDYRIVLHGNGHSISVQ